MHPFPITSFPWDTSRLLLSPPFCGPCLNILQEVLRFGHCFVCLLSHSLNKPLLSPHNPAQPLQFCESAAFTFQQNICTEYSRSPPKGKLYALQVELTAKIIHANKTITCFHTSSINTYILEGDFLSCFVFCFDFWLFFFRTYHRRTVAGFLIWLLQANVSQKLRF